MPLYSKCFSPSEGTAVSVRLRSTCHTDIQQTYVFQKVLGHGQFGTVREATSLISQQQVAVKSISKEKAGTNLHLLRRELEIMRLLDHPNVIKYFETYEDEKYIHIVMELCTGGDLFDKLIALGSLSERHAAEILTSLLLAVSHLHSLGICHRDLKPENFLFETSVPDALVKIIDFGLSLKHANGAEMNSLVGTPYFLAPEVLQGKYGPKCDVWSLGVVLYVLLSGKLPFEGTTRKDLFTAISSTKLDFSEPIWDGISHLAQNLLLQMLTKRPSDRISISEAIDHPWFQSQKGENAPTVSPSVLQRLKTHKSPQKLQREVMKIMLKFLSTAEIEELRQAFLSLDQAKNGFLTAADIEKALETAGFPLQVEEIRSNCHLEIAAGLETASIGRIHYSDFLIATLDKKKLLDDELLYLTFQHFDSDFDGFVDIKDLKQAFESLGDSGSLQEIEEMVADWDLDHNHLIDFEEFRRMMAEGREVHSENRSFQRQSSMKRDRNMHKTLMRLTTLCE